MAKKYNIPEAYLRSLSEDTIKLTYDQIREYGGLEKLPKPVSEHVYQYLNNSKSQPIPAAWPRAGWWKSNHNYSEQCIDLHHSVPLEAVTLVDDVGGGGVQNEDRQLVSVETRCDQCGSHECLRRAYGDACAITGSVVMPLLEATHIMPHAHKMNYATSNGLLLRADVHALFGMHLITVDSDGRIAVPGRFQDTEYARYHLQRLKALPRTPVDQPPSESPKRHHGRFLTSQEATHSAA